MRLATTLRAVLLVAFLTGTGVPLARVALAPAARLTGAAAGGEIGTVPFEAVLTGLAATTVLLAVGWLAAVLSLQLLGGLLRVWTPGRSAAGRTTWVADRLTPRLVSRVAAAALGVAVVTGSGVAPATAGGSGSGRPVAPGGRTGLAGLAVPDRTTGRLAPAPGRPAGAGASVQHLTVVVHPGDCLWSIAAGRLPTDASTARLARAVRRVYAANRPAIGDDPDLIRPGTTLLVPLRLSTDRKDSP